MSEDVKTELAKGAFGFVDKYGERLWKGVQHLYREASMEARLNWKLGYERYIKKASERYFYAKSFLNTTEPQPLYSFYVPLGMRCGETLIQRASIGDLISSNRFVVITATGGSGKTMMMRHLFMDALSATHQVPVFVELRSLNNTEHSLISLISKKLRENDFDFRDEYILAALRAGHFVILLDGFDEVAESQRRTVAEEIEELCTDFRENTIIVSSRPDDSLRRWELFKIWRVLPLDLQLALELIRNSHTDAEVSEKFIAELEAGLFENHESFLSNPLLLSIMLITYENAGNIPHKLSTFYERAYTALFEQHDARKAYSRTKRTDLDIADFRRLFAAFCFLSHIRSSFSFSDAALVDELENAKKLVGVECVTVDFIHDAVQAVCLLIRDGLEIRFSHRSFQEYFAIVFIAQFSDEKIRRMFLNHQASHGSPDESLELTLQIAPEIVEKDFLIPKMLELEELVGFTGHYDEKIHFKVLSRLYSGICVNQDDDTQEWGVGFTVINSPHYRACEILRRHYYTPKELAASKTDAKEIEKENLLEYLNASFDYEEVFHIGVPIQKAINDARLRHFLREGWMGMDYLGDIFQLRAQLQEKHANQSTLLEEALLHMDPKSKND